MARWCTEASSLWPWKCVHCRRPTVPWAGGAHIDCHFAWLKSRNVLQIMDFRATHEGDADG